MKEAPKPSNENERLAALDAYQILDTDPEEAFDDLTQIASRVCGTPIALVSLVDSERQWFKSKVGVDAPETPRSIAFCAHAILDPGEVFVVQDAREDTRFIDNPLVTQDPKIRFYAGAPLVTPDNQPLGTLCVIDPNPRTLDDDQLETLRALARQVIGQMELRKKYIELTDIARRLEQGKSEIEHKNAEINTFYHTLAHELKTPLTAAREFVAIVRDEIAGPVTDEQRGYLGTAKECCDQIRTYIDDLLDMTRLETGKLGIEQSSGSMSTIVSRVLSAFAPAARKAELVLVERVPEDLPPVFVDERRIAQTLTNLISNAIKFTPAGGEVAVTAEYEAEGEMVLVKVSDTGVGIEPQHRDRVFDRLYQVRKDDSTIKGGLGVGLSLCREIVRLHGGSIDVTSEPGSGSVFTFSLPVASRVEKVLT